MTPSPSQSDVYAALRAFLLNVLPAGVEVVEGQDNRVPEPSSSDFVVMTATHRRRIETNIDAYADMQFTGSISGNTLTVSVVNFGSIVIGAPVFGANVAVGTIISSFGTGTGGAGTYSISPSQGNIAPETMAAGTAGILQPTEVSIQLDVHGPNSADNAQVITTLFRDIYATDFFGGTGEFFGTQIPATGIAPLYADDPIQIPFINDQKQIETRWVVDAKLQANQIVMVPEQFAAALAIGALIPVDIEDRA